MPSWIKKLIFVIALLGAIITWRYSTMLHKPHKTAPPGESPGPVQRQLVFLAKNGIVRESGAQKPLAGNKIPVQPVVVIGRNDSGLPPGLLKFESRMYHKAAEILTNYTQKIVGVDLRIIKTDTSGAQNPAQRIFIGAEKNSIEEFPELKGADEHGFVIAMKGDGLHIVSRSGIGTLYGVWFFLMNYAGLRIVMPGELGEIYEKMSSLEIPADLYVFNPGPEYLLRIWSGENGFDPTAWLADTHQSQRFQYHHNMFTIYAPERFGKNHPEFYPVFQGKRYIPEPREKDHWQPTLSDPATVARAVEYADELFTKRPDMKSMSLTLNDGGGHSEIDLEKARPAGVPYRDIYYSYVNAVARQVKAKWPDKYVVFLPYEEVLKPPSFKLEDNVIMFVFSYQGNPQETLRDWEGKVSRIGVYQWLYGSTWVIPNHWPHGIRDYLRLISAQGGTAFKGEFYGAWAQDGAKLWVLNNLFWNSRADVDALLADYFERMYGQAAAPVMARYFQRAEDVYERRRAPEKFNLCWWPGAEQQFKDWTRNDFNAMAADLKEAADKAQGPENQKRVDLTARCFKYGEAWWNKWQAWQAFSNCLAAAADDAAGLETRLEKAVAFLRAQDAVWAYRDQELEPFPQYCFSGQDMSKYGVDWKANWWFLEHGFKFGGDTDQKVLQICRNITDMKKKDLTPAQAAQYWKTQMESRPELKPYAQEQWLQLLYPSAPLKNLLSNGAFTIPADPADPKQQQVLKDIQAERIRYFNSDGYRAPAIVCRDWYVYNERGVVLKVERIQEPAETNGWCVTVKGVCLHGGVMYAGTLPDNRSRYRLSFQYRTTDKANGFCGMMFYHVKQLPGIHGKLPASREWKKHEQEFVFDYGASALPDFTLVLAMEYGKEDSQVWFRDVRLEWLSPEGIAQGKP